MMDTNGKVYTGDERWVTIGGGDEDGGGHHVLIKENGTIVAGFGTGKNVRNAFGGKKADTPAKANAAVRFKESKPKERESDAKLRREIEMDIESRMVRGSTEKDRPRFIKEKGELYKGIVEWAQRSLKDASAMKGMPEDTLQTYRDRLERAQRKFDLFNKMYPNVFKGAGKGVPEKEKEKKGNGVNISKATSNMMGGKFRNRTQERNEAQNKIEEVEEKNRKRMRREFRRYDKEREGQKQEESAIWKKHGEARRYGDAARRLNNLNPDKYNNLIKKVKRRGELASTEANEKGQELSSRMARSYADHEARKSEIMRTGRLERYPLIKQQNKRDKAIESAQSSLANAREKLKPIREKANTERLAKGDIIVTSPKTGKTYRYSLGTSGADSIRGKNLNREYHHIGGMKDFITKLKKDGYKVERDYDGLGSSSVKVTSPDGKSYNYRPSAKGKDYIYQSDLGKSYYYQGGLPALLKKVDKEGYDIASNRRQISKLSQNLYNAKAKTNASEKAEIGKRFSEQVDKNRKRHDKKVAEQGGNTTRRLKEWKGLTKTNTHRWRVACAKNTILRKRSGTPT